MLESVLSNEKKLMYDIIFNDKLEYEIPFLEYICNMIDVDTFTNRIINNLNASGIKVKGDILILTKDKKVWILKIER
jgi:hypothetical protein